MYPPYRTEKKASHMADIHRPEAWKETPMWEEFEQEKNHFDFVPDFIPEQRTLPKKEEAYVLPSLNVNFSRKKNFSFPFIKTFIFGLTILGSLTVFAIYQAEKIKTNVLSQSENGYMNLSLALEDLRAKKYNSALSHFNQASASFEKADGGLTAAGKIFAEILRPIPGLSKMASGKHIIEAGKHFSAAGVPLSEIAQKASLSHDAYREGEKISLLATLSRLKDPLNDIRNELQHGSDALEKVQISDIPPEKRERFLEVKTGLPQILDLLNGFDTHEALIHELLGGNGPRKYLFLLQNNHEMRATGGFIGSYALLDVNDGVVRRFFVDGIFNPDGQLRENIVPPKPIQKVSAAWSLHDSNWFPDFPTSAEKAISFYEKTGGPTVDGVITLTPTVMQKLLAVTGPITMSEYGLTVDADNFIPVIQEQVEVKYDKAENKPKKILADLSLLLIEKVFASQDRETLFKVGEALVEGLNEKHMLLYMRHPETEALIDEAGWSGKVYSSKKDYLSVIHSNINGYKTDGVIDENISHAAEIKEDGSIIDTVTITRVHNGGNTPYEWWNKVNADYMRVYVPLGSELLSAKGATWEFPQAPLDYDRLGFKRDERVEKEEHSTRIDEKSGTRISEDAGKTVFGNWVYVSPHESVTVEYAYKLPFHIDVSKSKADADSFSVLYQKQSGSKGSDLSSSIKYPQAWKVIWQTSPNLVPYERELRLKTDLRTDTFAGAVFGSR